MAFVSAPGQFWSDLFDDGLLDGIVNGKALASPVSFGHGVVLWQEKL